ncbi:MULTISPECIES: flagellar hook-length control protein FliK [Photorhabdus]|uniref:Flagellar hook-length control protein n=2 Tax=Photorhabdus asymbiotica TaxID=291112 RepID=C7BNU3_PHOAA|nr:flagellar hook-length control protein FliK [Photorhabdus asymbiotica]RKS56930.1 flagellar hook-length control protein FliK [Photorhabdus asymbiotica]CAQ84712.1 flagellar hook-length control protein [Photorhabdus asymbiotica]
MNITLLPADLKPAENQQTYSDLITDSEQPSAFAQFLNLETEPAQKGMIKPGKISSKEGKESTDDTNNGLSPLLSISPEIPAESINASLIPLNAKAEVNKQPAPVDEKLMSAEELAANLPVQLSGLAIRSENQQEAPQLTGLIAHNAKNLRDFSKESKVTELPTAKNLLTDTPEQTKQAEKVEELFKTKPENELGQHPQVKPKLAPATIQRGIQPESTTQNHPRESVLIQTTAPAEIQSTPITTENQQTGQISAVTTSPLLSAGHNQTAQFQLSSASTPLLNAQLGSEEWQQQLSQQIMLFNRNGLQQAELRLHPQELGALQIRMSVEDNQAQLHLASAHSHVRAALEAALPNLRHALAETGIQLTQSSISSDNSTPWQQEQRSGSQNSGSGKGHNANTSPESLSATETTINLTPHQLASARGGVDIFA